MQLFEIDFIIAAPKRNARFFSHEATLNASLIFHKLAQLRSFVKDRTFSGHILRVGIHLT